MSHVILPASVLYFPPRVRDHTHAIFQRHWSALPRRKSYIVCREDLYQGDLDLIGGEESARAGMLTMAERDMLIAGCDELIFGLITRLLA